VPETKTRPQSQNKTSLLKMKELTRITGVPKSTILLYVNQGLLPKPLKTSPNMAYYDPLCIERIAFIKQVQSCHRLPLAAIKGLIREMDKGRNVDLMLELQNQVFGCGENMVSKKEFCIVTGLSEKELDRLSDLELIIPLEKDHFNAQDKTIGILLKQSLDLGMNPDDLNFYPRIAKELVDRELSVREKHTKDLPFDENASLTLELTRMARSIRSYVIDRTMQKKLMEYKGLKK